jgi:succinate-semialdehyde dehydrogenase/glutarate-semialdehyde dehydrogenase
MSLSEQELLAKVPTGLFIGGKWVSGGATDAIAVEDPATGQVLLEIANANAQDGLAALTAALSLIHI